MSAMRMWQNVQYYNGYYLVHFYRLTFVLLGYMSMLLFADFV